MTFFTIDEITYKPKAPCGLSAASGTECTNAASHFLVGHGCAFLSRWLFRKPTVGQTVISDAISLATTQPTVVQTQTHKGPPPSSNRRLCRSAAVGDTWLRIASLSLLRYQSPESMIVAGAQVDNFDLLRDELDQNMLVSNDLTEPNSLRSAADE
jgi:hypothetical protein